MAPRAHRNEKQGGIEQEAAAQSTPPAAPEAPELVREAWEHTDRLLSFATRANRRRPLKDAASTQVVRQRWLEEHGVQTEFLDGGIGCCWFAHQGDREPVSGQTEDEAIDRLARACGWEGPGA